MELKHRTDISEKYVVCMYSRQTRRNKYWRRVKSWSFFLVCGCFCCRCCCLFSVVFFVSFKLFRIALHLRCCFSFCCCCYILISATILPNCAEKKESRHCKVGDHHAYSILISLHALHKYTHTCMCISMFMFISFVYLFFWLSFSLLWATEWHFVRYTKYSYRSVGTLYDLICFSVIEYACACVC